MIDSALRCKREHPRYAYVGPLLGQAKETSWDYLKRFSQPIFSKPPNESELYVELVNGARIRIHGADNVDRLRGAYLDGVVLDEYADMNPSLWGSVVRPMLADRGGSAIFIGTPKGRNSFWQIVQQAKNDSVNWFHAILPASETGILPAAEPEAAIRDMTPEQYDQEFQCSFDSAIVGAFYGKMIAEAERQGRIGTVAYDPMLPVHTAWDLGIGDSTAIWFAQFVGAEIRVIDFYENNAQPLAHYADVLAGKGYEYGLDYMPHDAKVRELGTGKTRVETLGELGRKPTLIANHKVEDGINAVRLALPRCWFDGSKCAVGIEALRQYRSDYDEKKRAFADRPRHDWTSHAADGFRYLAMGWREAAKPEPIPPKPVLKGLYETTFDELWESIEGTPDRPFRDERI
jgi:phage terminase large subunit